MIVSIFWYIFILNSRLGYADFSNRGRKLKESMKPLKSSPKDLKNPDQVYKRNLIPS